MFETIFKFSINDSYITGIVNSGDIELNPGPLSECSTTSVSTDISVDESLIRNKFSLVHFTMCKAWQTKQIFYNPNFLILISSV